MGQNRVSIFDPRSNGDRRLRDLIEQHRVLGIIPLLMGLSQVILGMHFIGPGPLLATPSSWVGFVLAAGGWLLIGIGFNVFQGREAFDGGWIDSERVTWVWAVTTVVFTVGIATATVWVVLS
jgi:hypothetical protein